MENNLSYLTILLNDLEQTKNQLSNYNNTILILKATYSDPSDTQDENLYKKLNKKMQPEEKQSLAQTIAYFRAYATRAYISYRSISSKLNSPKKQIIEDTYNKIKTQVMPDYDTAEAFVQALNDIFVDEINIQQLLGNAEKTGTLADTSSAPRLV